MQCTPPELANIAAATIKTLIPAKSKKVYYFAYKRFIRWTKDHDACVYSETVLLACFSHLSQAMKSSTLCYIYSMLNAELNVKNNINIDKYTKLIAFLKRQGEGYRPKKSKVLTKEQFDNFLQNVPNNVYLATKVILIFGVSGACRCDEFLHLNVTDIGDLGSLILVKIANSKTKRARSFTIMGDFYINLYRDYASLCPKELNTSKFFIQYQQGKCHRVVMETHKISSVARDVASYLHLQSPHEYTGYCLRRTSATFLVDNGGDIASLKRHGGWRSSSVTEGYLEESITNKKQTAKKILAPSNYNEPSTSTFSQVNWDTSETIAANNNIENNATITKHSDHIMNIETEATSKVLNMQNCSIHNSTFDITLKK